MQNIIPDTDTGPISLTVGNLMVFYQYYIPTMHQEGNETTLIYRARCKLCGSVKDYKALSLQNAISDPCGCIKNGEMLVATLIGKKFGMLTVEYKTQNKYYSSYLYHCRCDCGGVKLATSTQLKRKMVQSCGCLGKGKALEARMIGKKFGKLTVEYRTDIKHSRTYLYHCKCDCGGVKLVPAYQLKRGLVQSCGCIWNGRAADAEMIGKKFGKLTVEYRTNEKYFNSYLLHCRCDCGGVRLVTASALRRGITTNCGCVNRFAAAQAEMIGKKFGKLTVEYRTDEKSVTNSYLYHCRCDCGGVKLATSSQLKRGTITTCGCSRKGRRHPAITQQKTPAGS